MVEDQMSQNRRQLLPIMREHIYTLVSLPDLHLVSSQSNPMTL
jgi:PIN domain nuclease of toxin-antitoxin system